MNRVPLADRVLAVVDLVPAGRVVTYGDIAELLRCSPRMVGRHLALRGSETTWWRVTNSVGDLPPHLIDEAAQRWDVEGIAVKKNGRGCRIDQHRADLVALADAYEAGG